MKFNAPPVSGERKKELYLFEKHAKIRFKRIELLNLSFCHRFVDFVVRIRFSQRFACVDVLFGQDDGALSSSTMAPDEAVIELT